MTTLVELTPHQPLSWWGSQQKIAHVAWGSFPSFLKVPHQEAENLKPYEWGDPISKIDWRVFGRTRSLMIREKRPDVQAAQRIIFDTRASMWWPPRENFPVQGPMKFELCIRLTWSLAALFLKCGDPCELWFQDEDGFFKFSSRNSGFGTLMNLLASFDSLEKEEFSQQSWLELREGIRRDAAARVTLQDARKARLYYLSDCFDAKIFQLIPADAFLLQVLSSFETDLQWMPRGSSSLNDSVQKKSLYLRSELVHDGLYQKSLKEYSQKLTRHFATVVTLNEQSSTSFLLAELRRLDRRGFF